MHWLSSRRIASRVSDLNNGMRASVCEFCIISPPDCGCVETTGYPQFGGGKQGCGGRAVKVNLPPERSIRLAAGLILFAYAGTHLLSHATGLFLLDAIQAVGHDMLLWPWRTPVGLSVLLASFLLHLS